MLACPASFLRKYSRLPKAFGIAGMIRVLIYDVMEKYIFAVREQRYASIRLPPS